MAFVMLIVACGRYVAVKGDMEATARDAARAASLERELAPARSAAGVVVENSLDRDTRCRATQVGGDFRAGGIVTVQLDCQVSYDGLGLIGLPGSVAVVASSSAPIDPFRRTG
jgi:Flp pilus assembly protein TadG